MSVTYNWHENWGVLMVSISTFLSKLSTLVDSYRRISVVKNLADELEKYIRPEYIKEPDESGKPHAINVKAILDGLDINTELNREEVLEELVDEFKDQKYAEQILVEMETLARKKFGKDAVDLVGYGTTLRGLTPDEQKKVEEMVKDLGPYGAQHIKIHLKNYYINYLGRHTTIKYLEKKHEEIEKKDEESPGTNLNDLKFLHSEILNFLRKEHPGHNNLWAKVFEKAFDVDGRSDKTLKQLAGDFDLPLTSFFDNVFSPMMKTIKEFLKSQGYHGDKKEVEKEIEEDINDDLKKTPPKEGLPDYQTYLKEPQNSKEFKEYLHKTKPSKMSPRVVKILELFGDGLSNREVLTKMPEEKPEDIARAKSDVFKKYYKNWYEEKMKKLTENEDEEKVAGFFMPYMRVDSEKSDEKKEPASIYKRMADTGRMGLLVEFNSDYTKQDMPKPDEKGKIPDPNFEFQSFIYTLNNFKKQHSLEYRYIEKPKDKAGNMEKGLGGESLLKLDGKPSNDHEVKKEIDDRIEKLKQEGVYPHISGLSVTYKNTNKKYPGSKGIYKGVQSFDSAFAELAPNDEPHTERSKNFNLLQVKKKTGPSLGQSATLDARRKIRVMEEELDSIEALLPIKALKDTQRELEKEEAKPAESQDKERIKSLKTQVESYKELIQDKKLVKRRDELQELISELNKFVTHKTIQPDTLEEYDDIKERVKEFHESDFVKDELKEVREDLKEEKEKPVEEQDKDYIKQLEKEEQGLLKLLRDQENMEREADSYGDIAKYMLPPDAKVKELIKIFEDYGLKASELQRWTEPKDLKILAKTLKNTIDNTMEAELKKEKDEAAKTEIIKKHEKVLSGDTVKLFEDVPKDLKRRRDELKSKSPEKFTELSKSRDLDWVDDASGVGSIMSYVKDVLLTKEKGKIHLKEKGPSFTVMPKADYKDLANHLHLEQMSLNVFADRFSEMPLTLPKGKEENKGGKGSQ